MVFDPKIFGATVKRARIACGCTQEKLAESLYCTQAYVSQIERGEAVPSLPMFVSITQSLHVNACTLLGDLPEQTSPPPGTLQTEDKAFLCEELSRIILQLLT